MTFWTDPKLDPVRKYRFTVNGGAGDGHQYWYAKSMDKPKVSVNVGEYQLINHKFKFPGVPAWEDVSLVLVDVGKKAGESLKQLMEFGYNYPDEGNGVSGMKKTGANFIITQFDASGTDIETWELKNAWIKSIDFGSLAYSDDELVEITISIAYDYAELTEGMPE